MQTMAIFGIVVLAVFLLGGRRSPDAVSRTSCDTRKCDPCKCTVVRQF